MKFQTTALLLMATSVFSWGWGFETNRKAARNYLRGVEFRNNGGSPFQEQSPDSIQYGQLDQNVLTGVETSQNNEGQPIDVGMLELLTKNPASNTYRGLSDGHYYKWCTAKLLDVMSVTNVGGFVNGVYAQLVDGKAWKNTAWIAGCDKADDTYTHKQKAEDTFMSKHFVGKGTFNASMNALPAEALNNAKDVQLKSITAWQRPLLVDEKNIGTMGAARRSINMWASMPVWSTPLYHFSFNQSMKYAVRDVMEHWFLVCEFEYQGESLFVRIERVQTGILVTRCEHADVSQGASYDATCLPKGGVNGHSGAQKISDTSNVQYTNDSPAAQGITLEHVLKFCVGQQDKRYSMFFNNCRQFAKFAFDKFTSKTLYIPSLDKGFYERTGYGSTGDGKY